MWDCFLPCQSSSHRGTRTDVSGYSKVHIYFDRPTQPTTRVSMRAHFTPEAIHKLTRKLSSSPYRLLQSEILQILNHVPREVTELSMIVEDAEDRFEENVLEEIVQAIHTILKVKWRGDIGKQKLFDTIMIGTDDAASLKGPPWTQVDGACF